ncbi:MAG: hypothetical protein OXG74_05805 [Acidobacteria bacterium]|nr:hypothetical protein [Acidobacteriota bacterium]
MRETLRGALLSAMLMLLALPLTAQAPDDDNEPLVALFSLPEDAHPLDIRSDLLDFIDGTDEQGIEEFWYLVFHAVYDDPTIAAMMAWTGASKPPELPHPNVARNELMDLIQTADDETLLGLREMLRAPLGSDEARWIFGLLNAGTHNEPLESDLVTVEAAQRQNGQCKNRIGPGPNCGNYNPKSSNCWDRVPQISPGPAGSIFYPRQAMQDFCKDGVIKRGKCRIYKTAYRRDAKKGGNPCSFR